MIQLKAKKSATQAINTSWKVWFQMNKKDLGIWINWMISTSGGGYFKNLPTKFSRYYFKNNIETSGWQIITITTRIMCEKIINTWFACINLIFFTKWRIKNLKFLKCPDHFYRIFINFAAKLSKLACVLKSTITKKEELSGGYETT